MRAQRGFVILLVLVMLAILSAAVIAQFASTGNNEVIALRSADDAKARALAESCLTLLQEYAEGFMGPTPAAGADFDALLNPDNVAAFAAAAPFEYLPTALAGDAAVLLPKGLTGSADLLARHRWLVVPKAVGTERGACLLRFDDNADEALPLSNLPAGASDGPLTEGAAATSEVTWLDRDRAIYLTAIGLFPFLTSTPAADAYGAAHARVTLRRLYNAGGAAVAGGVAIMALGNVSGIKGPVCGGGISGNGFAPKGSPIRGSGCACGPLTFTSAAAAPPQCTPAQCTTCGAVSTPTAPFASLSAAVTPALAAEVPPGSWSPFDVLANQSFGPAPPTGAPAPLIDLSAADLGGGKASCKFFYANGGDVYVWDRLANPAPVSGENCTSYITDPVGRPCTWTVAAAAPWTITSCGAGETACWKKVHDVTTGTTFRPNRGAFIPSVDGGNKNWGAVVGAGDYLCGDQTPAIPPGPCSGCDGAGNDAGTWVAPAWNFSSMDNTDLPVPAYLAVENANPVTDVTLVSNPGGSGAPLHVSIASNGPVTVAGNGSSLCGASCDCTSMGGTTIATCTPAGVGALAGQTCSAIRTGRRYGLGAGTNTLYVVGAIRAGTVLEDTLGGGGCYVGGVAAMGGGPSCGASYCDATNLLCWSGRSNVVGDLYSAGSAILQGTNELYGTLASQNDFCANPGGGVRVFGNIVAGGDVQSKGAFRVTFSGASAVSAIFALKSMMETAW